MPREFQNVSFRTTAFFAFFGGQMLGSFAVKADDFVVNSPTIVQNGDALNVLNGGDSLTITNGGSITTGAVGAVLGVGNNNTINNDGSVATTGNGDHGISSADNGAINNNGSISTTGNNADGIFANDGNTITSSGSISTDGNNSDGIFANDGNTITNGGSISTLFNTSRGIVVGDNNTVSNSGSITTIFNNSRGILADDNNIISNSGSITTGGNNAEGIFVNDGNTITNCGTIITTGNNTEDIFANNGNTIINCGSISTSGNNASSIFANDNNTITNSGSISTAGTNSQGISVIDNNVINNVGSITISGNNSEGILANDGNTITVGGSILTTGTNSPAISVDSNSTVNISGSVIATQSDAVLFTGTNNTLNLNASATITGGFDLGTNTTLNIDIGSSGSVMWTFDPTQLVGGVPNIVGAGQVFQTFSGGILQIASFDPTALAASSDGLGQLGGALSGLMQQRLAGGGAGLFNSGDNTFVSTWESKNRISNAHDGGLKSHVGVVAPEAWLSLFGGSSDYDSTGATLGFNVSLRGAAGGYDWSPTADLKFGFMLGYLEQGMESSSLTAHSYDNDTSGFFTGIYGRYNLDETMSVDFSLIGGVSDHSHNRFVNDSLAAVGESNSYWLSPEIAIGTKYQLTNGWLASPSARVRYLSQWHDGYDETGPSASNATIGSHQVAIGEASVEFAVNKQTKKGLTTLRVGYLYSTVFGDAAVNITMLGQTRNVSTFAQDRAAGYVAANTNYHLTEMLDLELGGKATVGGDFTSFQGNLRLVAKF